MQPSETKLEVSSAKGGAAGLNGNPGTGGVAEIEGAKRNEQTATPARDFVLAYRLRKVHVSWRGKVTLGDDVAKADLYRDEGFGDIRLVLVSVIPEARMRPRKRLMRWRWRTRTLVLLFWPVTRRGRASMGTMARSVW
jgi:hypothetical protein